MPCDSSYMEPNGKEKQLQRTANLYAYVLQKLGVPVPQAVIMAGDDIYCTADYVPSLCKLLRALPLGDRDQLMYGNAREKVARDLADWWEEHDRADSDRDAMESQRQKRTALIQSARGKLTKAELEALGLV